jgi:putative transposase
MAWRAESTMDHACVLSSCLRADELMSSLCLRFEISRKTGYKWLSPYRDFGAVGLVEFSSARHTLAPAMDPAITDAVTALRKQGPAWGPCKLSARLSLDRPEIVWPASSTIGDFCIGKVFRGRGRDERATRPPSNPKLSH